MRKIIVSIMIAIVTLAGFSVPAQAATTPAVQAAASLTAQAATPATYGDFTRMFDRSAGQYASGTQYYQWAWSPQSTVESQVSWGAPWGETPPAYRERFVRDGDWLTQPGWFDNGTYYELRTTTEWTANADCRTGKTFFPAGGGQHYAKWLVPSVAYCVYAEATITEQLSGKSYRYIHQQVWSPPAACPKLSQPVLDPANKPVPVSDCVSQWESWADDRGTPGVFMVKLERTVWLARGIGMAYRVVQTVPSAWSAEARRMWTW